MAVVGGKDERSVPMVWKIFGGKNSERQARTPSRDSHVQLRLRYGLGVPSYSFVDSLVQYFYCPLIHTI